MIPVPAFGDSPMQPQPPAVPAPAHQPPAADVKLDEIILKYRLLRDKKEEIAKRHAEELRPYTEGLSQLGSLLLDLLNRAGQESCRTVNGTAFKQTRNSYTVGDSVIFRNWLEEDPSRFVLLDTRVSKNALDEFIAANGDMPPGVNISSTVVVNVRK